MTDSAPIARVRPHAMRRLLSLCLLAGAVSLSPTRAAAPVPVDINKFAFVPKELTVRPGTTVTWTNHDQTPHLITARDKTFASKGMDTDDHFSFTFTHPGDYSYFCTMHPFMTGVVHVSAK